MKSKWFKALLLIMSLVILGFGYHQHRNHQMDSLFAVALGETDQAFDAVKAETAVKQLGKFHGRRSTNLLLKTLWDDRSRSVLGMPLVGADDVEESVLGELKRRTLPSILSEQAASLLVPHRNLVERQFAVRVLEITSCNSTCIRMILHYLERTWRGEANFEDHRNQETDEKINSSLYKSELESLKASMFAKTKQEQKDLYDSLYKILQREPFATIMALQQTYGIGEEYSSPFVAHILAKFSLSDACAALKQNPRQIEQFTDAIQTSWDVRNYSRAMESLGCY
jgi:hypothetical protein